MASDTIVAVSSPAGRSARGLIRLAGPAAFEVLRSLVTTRDAKPRHMVSARLHHATLPPLPLLVAKFPGPHSYTGGDVAELQLPGHPALLDRVVHAVLKLGARLAEPGEFTFRAYTAGRLDLTEAEGVAATINAVSDGQLAAAAHLRNGELARFTADHVDRLGSLLALVESGIDFVDQEDVVPIAPRKLAEALCDEHDNLTRLLGRSRSWGAVESLPRVVLVGPPSAGKSTLFNALLGRPRAVIDATPGTTRDVLEEPLTLQPSGRASGGGSGGGGAEVMLVDIAGLDRTASRLDRQIQQQATDAIRRADLLVVFDQSGPAREANCPVLRVQTKCDLEDETPSDPAGGDPESIRVSGVTGAGLDTLRQAILDRLGDRAVSIRAELLALQPRHEAALQAAREALGEALVHVDLEARALDEIELVAGAMRAALDQLAGLGGQLTPDDVIGRVFATFCVGK